MGGIVAEDITGLIGNTPMVRINKLTGPEDATIYAKLEWYNVGGSVKDRMALSLIEYAEAAGKMDRDKAIIEATSGNTGIALAMIGAVKGYKVVIIMPENVSIERRCLISAYGAELILSPAEKGTAGAIELKRKILREEGDRYIDLDQFKDPANILAHYKTTGEEILRQTGGGEARRDRGRYRDGWDGRRGFDAGQEAQPGHKDRGGDARARRQHPGIKEPRRAPSDPAFQEGLLRRDRGDLPRGGPEDLRDR
jgi:hypothetical protein